ncbi:hypothetical protein L9F63_016369, partial [Diploptera punctata]
MWDPEEGGVVGPGEEPQPPSQGEELKEQFQQQQHKIEEMKKILKENEEKLMSRGKEVEKYASKLSDIRSRSRAAKRKSTTPVAVQDTSQTKTPDQEVETSKDDEASTPRRSSAKKAQGNLHLLITQLEENRAKFQLRDKEINENRKGIEDMIQHLKNQLDDRDVQIKELQKRLETHQPMEDVQEETEEHRTSIDSSISVEGDTAQQIVHKNKKIVELNRKIADLETKVIDLQESFSEKDSVIEARTKAIALMSEDFSRRSKTTVDNLEETREEMRKMQSNFVLEETKLKQEIEELKKELSTKNQKLHQVEENNKELLSIRFDLSARNAELQQKVVKVNEKNYELQKRLNEVNELKDNLQSQLDDANKQMTKLKAHYKSKMRSLTKQSEGLKRVIKINYIIFFFIGTYTTSDADEEITKLQNRIAELEEDKGNLQLHLVDFDELKVSESHWQTRVSELEERVSQQNQDLDTHVHMIALLEAEKLDHIKDIQQRQETLISLEEEIEKLKDVSLELENQKLSLEMKIVDLEEQIDIVNKEKKELQEELEAKSISYNTVEKHVYEEKQHLADNNSSGQSIEVIGIEEQRQESEFNVGSQPMNKSDLEAELENLRRVIEEQKSIIMDLNFKIDSRDEELDLQREMITNLEHLSGNDKEDKIMDIVKELNEMASDLEEWKKRCTEVENRLQVLGTEKDELEERFEEVKVENSTLKQQLNNQHEVATDLANKLKDHSNAISNRDEKINILQSMIEQNGQTLEAREMTLKDVHEKLNSVEKQYENRLSELKSVLHDKENEIMKMASSLGKQDDLLKDRDVQIQELNDKLNKEKQEFESLQQHISYVENSSHQLQIQLNEISTAAVEKDLLSSQMAQECQHHKEQIEKLSFELSNKTEYVNKIEMELNGFRVLETQLKTAEDNLKSQAEELGKLKLEMQSAKSELGEKQEKLNEAEKKVIELTEKNKKYIANLKARTVTVKGHEQKIQQYEVLIKEKESMILQLTATNEKILDELTDKNKSDSHEVQNYMEKMDNLTKELHEERARTELIGEELTRATEKIVSLEMDLKNSESKLQQRYMLEENHAMLSNKIMDLENEISQIQLSLKVKDEEINQLKEGNFRLNKQEEELKINLEENRLQHNELITSLEGKVMILENELTARKCELNEVRNIISDKELRIDQLTEQMTEISERGSQSLSANEAKLQEREAVVEFLEQEVTKSKETIQHLQERLAFVEERRLSLENKAEVLNLRAQESDRMKEEAFETEGMIEKRFEMLLASEESLKKKVGLLISENEELTQKVTELTTQNIEGKREIQNTECNAKDLLKEVERLTPFEFLFSQASENVETLELELKRINSEFEYRMNEKIHKLKQQSESLESDLRNVNMELEKVELEKRTLLERYEKLNDEKLNLEDEIEKQNETIASYKLANESLKEKFNTDEIKQELEERIQYLDTELAHKLSLLEEKDVLVNELAEKNKILESEILQKALTIDSLSSSKEELNKKLDELENVIKDMEASNQAHILEKDKVLTEMKDKINYFESKLMETSEAMSVDVSSSEYEERISHLNKELENLKLTVSQKNDEIKNYQKHMLQLQFESTPFSSEVNTAVEDQVLKLEQTKIELEEMLKAKETEIIKMNSVLNLSNIELEDLRSQHENSKLKIEALNKELDCFREYAKSKEIHRDINIQDLEKIAELDSIPEEHASLRNLQENQVSLEQQEELNKKLLVKQVEEEVSHIIDVAEKQVHRLFPSSIDLQLQVERRKKSISFQEAERERHRIEHSEVETHLENKIKELDEELKLVKMERDEALLRLSQLTIQPVESMPSDVSDNIILVLGTETQMDIKNEDNIDNQGQVSVPLQQMPPATTSETIVTSGLQNWELHEEEGWWGSDEAKLEEEHIQKQQNTLSFSEPVDVVLNKQIVELEDHIKDLEAEKQKLSEDLHNSQVRSGKMLKKLKELKLKNDNLLKENAELVKKKSEKDFSDLDQAIEEELKIQIDALEKEVNEITNERDSMIIEKDGLIKRIDVLTSANEKLVESKEKQDYDLELWKQKNKDLSNQIQSLEWKIGELEATSSVNFGIHDEKMEENAFFSWDKQGLSSNAENLFVNVNTETLQGQTVFPSGEDVSILLEKEKSLRQSAENHILDLQQRLIDVNMEIEQLGNENTNLKNQLEQLNQQETISDLQTAYDCLSEKYDFLCKEMEEFKISAESKYEMLKDESNKKLDELNNEYVKLEELCKNLQEERNILSTEIDGFNILNTQYLALQTDFDNLKAHTLVQEKNLTFADEEKLRLEQELYHLKSITERNSSDETAEMLSEQHVKIVQMEKELRVRIEEIEKLRQLIEEQKLEHARVEQEWNSKMERLRKELELSGESLLQQQNRYIMLEKEHEELKDHINKVIENKIHEAISIKEQEINIMKADLEEKESYFESQKEIIIQEEMKQKTEDIENLRHKLADSVDILNIRENDIKSLTSKLSEKELELHEILSVKNSDIQNLKIQMEDNEKRLNQILGQKDQDIENLNIQLSEKDLEINELKQSLNEEKRQFTDLKNLVESHEQELQQFRDESGAVRSENIPMLPTLNVQHHDVSTS